MKEQLKMGIGWEVRACDLNKKPSVVAVILGDEKHDMSIAEMEDFILDAKLADDAKEKRLGRWSK